MTHPMWGELTCTSTRGHALTRITRTKNKMDIIGRQNRQIMQWKRMTHELDVYTEGGYTRVSEECICAWRWSKRWMRLACRRLCRGPTRPWRTHEVEVQPRLCSRCPGRAYHTKRIFPATYAVPSEAARSVCARRLRRGTPGIWKRKHGVSSLTGITFEQLKMTSYSWTFVD